MFDISAMYDWVVWFICWSFKIQFGIGISMLSYLAYLHISKMRRIRTYKEQGVFMQPSYDKFVVGNCGCLIAHEG